jgi:hypothetical protein
LIEISANLFGIGQATKINLPNLSAIVRAPLPLVPGFPHGIVLQNREKAIQARLSAVFYLPRSLIFSKFTAR